MRYSLRTAAVVVLAALALASAGCTPVPVPSATPTSTGAAEPSASPTPTPTPTPLAVRPALGELELSVTGLGPLLLGAPPDAAPATSMVLYDPVGCTDAVTGESWGVVAGDPLAGVWNTDPSYATSSAVYGPGLAFGVGVDAAGNVQRIDLYSGDIPTDGGVRIGDPGAAVLAAHPDAMISAQYLTDVFVVSASSGLLQIEVAKDAPDLVGYWGAQLGTVVYIHAVSPALGVFSVAASGNLVGVCNFG